MGRYCAASCVCRCTLVSTSTIHLVSGAARVGLTQVSLRSNTQKGALQTKRHPMDLRYSYLGLHVHGLGRPLNCLVLIAGEIDS